MRSIVFSIGSDIGLALAKRRLDAGDTVGGTYRTPSLALEGLESRGARLVQADFADPASLDRACQSLADAPWDELVLATGTLEPIGLFAETDFPAWERSLDINLVRQLQVVHAMLPFRAPDALLLFFAGGGTQSAPPRFSAYTLAKIALIKFTELLHAECESLRVCILGPGWVRTKIHEETLRARDRAGSAFQATRDRLDRGDFVPMERVLDCMDWVRGQPREVMGGRNFSVAHDPWQHPGYPQWLRDHPDNAKLRRAGNAAFPSETHDA